MNPQYAAGSSLSRFLATHSSKELYEPKGNLRGQRHRSLFRFHGFDADLREGFPNLWGQVAEDPQEPGIRRVRQVEAGAFLAHRVLLEADVALRLVVDRD